VPSELTGSSNARSPLEQAIVELQRLHEILLAGDLEPCGSDGLNVWLRTPVRTSHMTFALPAKQKGKRNLNTHRKGTRRAIYQFYVRTRGLN
jgi:hypothetical protein